MIAFTFVELLAAASVAFAAPHLGNPVPRGLAPGFAPSAVTLSPANQENFCLGTIQAPGNDVALYLIPCNTDQTFWGAWEIQPGDNPTVKLSGTNFCLDAGAPPMNNGPAKLYTCFPGVPQQRWYYTGDLHIAITGGTQCLDYAVICGLGGCAPGTKNCGTTNTQAWTSKPASGNGGGGAGVQIHPNGDLTKCLTPSTRAYSNGVPLVFLPCIKKGDPFASLQLFDINKGAGQVKTTGSNFCLDSTTQFPPNGQGLKLWTCYSGLAQQNWFYTGDNHIAITGGRACADVKKEDGTTFQTWDCSGSDPQQVFTTSAQA
jgi:hypothetical protein